MIRIDINSATIEILQKAMGEAVAVHIRRQGTVKSFAKESGVARATIYRLLQGETVGTDVLFRVLRTLNRTDLLQLLVNPPEESPLAKWNRKNKSAKGYQSSESSPILSHLKTADKKVRS